MGDDDGGDSSLTKTIDPNLVNLNTTSTEEIHVQPQGGTNRKFCQEGGDESMLQKLLR